MTKIALSSATQVVIAPLATPERFTFGLQLAFEQFTEGIDIDYLLRLHESGSSMKADDMLIVSGLTLAFTNRSGYEISPGVYIFPADLPEAQVEAFMRGAASSQPKAMAAY